MGVMSDDATAGVGLVPTFSVVVFTEAMTLGVLELGVPLVTVNKVLLDWFVLRFKRFSH